MGTVRVISTSTIHAPPSHNDGDSAQKINLTPWDLQFLPVETIQKGLLFHTPNHQIQHLKHSLSSTLAFFPPLAGRLVITTNHQDNNTAASSFITCNNAGALFVHAAAENTSVADILGSNYVPSIVHSFFPLNGVKNFQGTSQPLLAVQVTELLDGGIFIGCTINHCVVDGKSFWLFLNSWAEISRGCPKPSKTPAFQRWFPNDTDIPIRFPFKKEIIEKKVQNSEERFTPPERIFNFTKEKIAELKHKANAEARTNRVSSLQALLTHLWRSVIRCKRLDPEQEVSYMLLIGVRPRLVPPLPEDYFGNAALVGGVTVKAWELEDGLGKGAWEMNKMVSLYSDEMVRNQYESWVSNPRLFYLGGLAGSQMATSSSPRFDVYGNDFGWGKPLAVRCGDANKGSGEVTVFAGREEGSIEIHVCLPYEVLEALGNDPQFTDAISN